MKPGYVIVYTQDVPAALAFYALAFGLKRRFLHESNQYGELDTVAVAAGAASLSAPEEKPLGADGGLRARPRRGAGRAVLADGVIGPYCVAGVLMG